MAQTKFLSTKADPKWLYCTALLLTLLAFGSGIWDEMYPPPVNHLIKWCSLAGSAHEAIKTHKPVFYVFSAEWCGPCKKMESIAFSNPEIANQINKKYVPVLVIDQMQEKGKNPPEIDRLQRQCDVRAFPTLMVVPPNLLDGKTKDVFSTGNAIERNILIAGLPWPYSMEAFQSADEDNTSVRSPFAGKVTDEILDMYHDRVPRHIGYAGISDIKNYLFQCVLWHKLSPSRGKINWKPIAQLSTPSQEPKLIAFVEDCGALSDKMRVQMFNDEESSSFIDENFASFIVELKHGDDTPNSEARALKEKFGIKALPAVVVLTGGERPSVLDGFTSSEHTLQFLRRALRVKGN